MKFLLFGPIPPPVTGQSIAFNEVYKRLDDTVLINTTKFGNKKIFNTLYSVFKLFQQIIFHNFETVYFTSSRSKSGFVKDFIMIQLCWFFKIKIINHVHGSDFSNFYKDSIIKPIIRYSYHKINISIVLFEEMKADFSEFHNMKIITVPNSYPTEFDSYNWACSSKKNKILYFSNIMLSKGIMDYLQAAEILLEFNDEFKFYIAGDFCSDEFLNKSDIKKIFYSRFNVINRKYPGRITYKGLLHGKEKMQLFEKCSFFILPTYYKTEALPISILEAMRSGNAIISTYHKYIPNMISKKHGVLVPIKSPKLIVDAILSLANNQNVLDSIIAYNSSSAIKTYSPQKYFNSIQLLLEKDKIK